MKNEDRTKELINGCDELRRRVAELERGEIKRRQAEEALRESEERYRTIIENSNDIIWTLDTEGNFLFANKRAEEISGYRLEDWRGRSFAPMVNKEDLPYLMEVLHKTQSGKPQQSEFSFKTRSGSSIILSVNSAPIYTKGKVVGTVNFGRDITEKKIAENIRLENERLIYANKAKSEFLASVSHDLRTPLNSIMGFSELVKQKTAGELTRKQERYVDNVLTSSKFLLELINNILDLAKIEAGKIELVYEKFDIVKAVNEVTVLLKVKTARHKIVLKKEFDPELEFIEADKQRFKQILFNLLGNALKFSKDGGGTVTITTKKMGDMAQFAVSDTGIGIREEDMPRLFKKFQQVDSKIPRKYGGTGLGLAISKELVELHGGKIMAESRFDEGSTFTFLLPIAEKKP